MLPRRRREFRVREMRLTQFRARLGSAQLMAITLLALRSAHAFPSSRLTYVRNKGTEQCPVESVVRSEVATRLGYDPFFVWAERTIVAQLYRDGRGFRATVQLLDDKGVVLGSRALHSSSDDCAELVKAMALAISISIDPESLNRPGAPPSEPAVTADSRQAGPAATDLPTHAGYAMPRMPHAASSQSRRFRPTCFVVRNTARGTRPSDRSDVPTGNAQSRRDNCHRNDPMCQATPPPQFTIASVRPT